MKARYSTISRVTALGLMAAFILLVNPASKSAFAASLKDVATTYADIAQAGYEDSLDEALKLQATINAFLAKPTFASHKAAKAAWKKARIPYQQTEAYRFGNKIVDEWEGRVNAWPLDEGLIDYVAGVYGAQSDENRLYVANVIASKSLKVGGKTIDASTITKELISGVLHEAEDVEANVATGYHAIEFLLWGQDLNGTGPGAGNRPATDFDLSNCTHGNCDRRADYLRAATELLIDDMNWMVAQWAPDGEARKAVLANEGQAGITALLTGMGSLSYGELAGERMKLGLLLHDPEEEHDCFSDNTHNSHYYDALGIQNVYLGRYGRINGKRITGASLSDLVRALNPALDMEMRGKLDATMAAMNALKKRAAGGEAFDQMIGEGNLAGNKIVQAAIDGLIAQTRSIERVVREMNLAAIQFEKSSSLDAPEEIRQ